MKFDELLEIKGHIVVIEPSYQGNLHIKDSLGVLHRIASDLSRFDEPVTARMVVIEDGEQAYAIGLYSPAGDEDSEGTWTVFTVVLDAEHQGIFEELLNVITNHVNRTGISIATVERRSFKDAMREYYSLKLMKEMGAYPVNLKFVQNKPRVERIKKLIGELKNYSDLSLSGKMIEICCGNGMATAALHELGLEPTCVDNDAYSIVEGLSSRALKPDKTILADATELSRVLAGEKFDTAIGFMLGDIDSFNKPMWTQILLETLKVTKSGGNLLFTVRTEPEARFIDEVVSELATGRVTCPDEEETLYDRWIYTGKKK
ncbi:hypothetical protein B6V01_004535 [Methanosarcinales archaeon ex4572_44]|nr:MAG: hypothetical protein B6V01_004535 [Methanosarcinales archaeon ex4572_44]